MTLNGRLTGNQLARTSTGHLLRADAAASYDRMASAFRRDMGLALAITDGYRDLAAQVALRALKGPWAALPGTSQHGWGLALDLGSRVNVSASREHAWMDAHAAEYGWVNPTWARDNDPQNGQHEPWHWEYVPALDQHGGGALAARPQGDDDEMSPEDRKLLHELHWMVGQVRGTDLPGIREQTDRLHAVHTGVDLANAALVNLLNGVKSLLARVR